METSINMRSRARRTSSFSLGLVPEIGACCDLRVLVLLFCGVGFMVRGFRGDDRIVVTVARTERKGKSKQLMVWITGEGCQQIDENKWNRIVRRVFVRFVTLIF